MKGQVYDMACDIYDALGNTMFTVTEAAAVLNEKNPSAMGARLFAMRNAGAIRVAFVEHTKHRIRHYQFTPRWVEFKETEPIREAKYERRRARVMEPQQVRQQEGVSNGG